MQLSPRVVRLFSGATLTFAAGLLLRLLILNLLLPESLLFLNLLGELTFCCEFPEDNLCL